MRDEGVIYVAGHPSLNRRCTSLPGCIRLRNDLYCVEWVVKLYLFNHSLKFIETFQNPFSFVHKYLLLKAEGKKYCVEWVVKLYLFNHSLKFIETFQNPFSFVHKYLLLKAEGKNKKMRGVQQGQLLI